MKKIVQAFILITVGTTMLTTSVFSASAHYLNDWANKYTWEAADTTNSFTINYSYHMDGNTTNYYFANSVAESYFATPIKQGFTMWGDLISGTKTAALSAHTKMSYDPGASPGGHPAIEWSRAGDGNHHFRRGYNDAEIIFYKEATTYTATEKKQLAGHELGHLWGIGDLYNHGKDKLESIYSQGYAFNSATRHDRNAIRIGLNNLNYDTGNGWKHQKSPGVWAKNEWAGRYYYNASGMRVDAFKIKYNANGGSGTMADTTVIYGVSTQTRPNAFTKTGYTFNGWYAKRASDNKWRYRHPSDSSQSGWYVEGTQPSGWVKHAYGNAGTLATVSSVNNDTVTFYAQWRPNTFTIVYNANGGSGTMANTVVTYGVSTRTRPNAFTKTGYTFYGWYAKRASDNKWRYRHPSDSSQSGWYVEGTQPSGWVKHAYGNAGTLATVSSVNNDTVTFYAQWK